MPLNTDDLHKETDTYLKQCIKNAHLLQSKTVEASGYWGIR